MRDKYISNVLIGRYGAYCEGAKAFYIGHRRLSDRRDGKVVYRPVQNPDTPFLLKYFLPCSSPLMREVPTSILMGT